MAWITKFVTSVLQQSTLLIQVIAKEPLCTCDPINHTSWDYWYNF